MSAAFSQSPPVYACSGNNPRPTNPSLYPTYPSTYSTPYPTYPTSYPTNPTSYSTNPTPYPTNSSMPMPNIGNPSYSYPHSYPQNTIPGEVYRESIQSDVINKVRYQYDESLQLGNVEIDSLKKTEEDLKKGEKTIDSLISNAQQEQVQAQVSILFVR
jgi:ESCRT-I complex subunit TSG101